MKYIKIALGLTGAISTILILIFFIDIIVYIGIGLIAFFILFCAYFITIDILERHFKCFQKK